MAAGQGWARCAEGEGEGERGRERGGEEEPAGRQVSSGEPRRWEKRIVEPVQLYRQSCSLEEADSGGWGFLSILGPSRK